jgi:sterol desaturase/sphingolipid hydroxylase (fatty acid hydroxylase superfamily)
MGILRSVGAFSVGFAVTPLLEYLWHARVGHGRVDHASGEAHRGHHKTASTVRDPWEEMGENAPLIARTLAAISAVLTPFVGARPSLSFSAGLASGYVFSTWYHARMHLRGPEGRYEDWMWRFHWHHHAADARVNFGLTNPVFDFMFGTAVVPDEVHIPERLRPSWLHEERKGFRIKHARTREHADAA